MERDVGRAVRVVPSVEANNQAPVTVDDDDAADRNLIEAAAELDNVSESAFSRDCRRAQRQRPETEKRRSEVQTVTSMVEATT